MNCQNILLRVFLCTGILCSQGKRGNNCSLCPKSTKIAGDMYFHVFFHIRIGATLENYSDPSFWGVKAPLFWSLFNYSKYLRDIKNILEQKLKNTKNDIIRLLSVFNILYINEITNI